MASQFHCSGKKPGSDFCWMPLKAPVDKEEELQEVTTGPGAAREMSADAAVLSGLNGLFTFIEKQRTTLAASLSGP